MFLAFNSTNISKKLFHHVISFRIRDSCFFIPSIWSNYHHICRISCLLTCSLNSSSKFCSNLFSIPAALLRSALVVCHPSALYKSRDHHFFIRDFWMTCFPFSIAEIILSLMILFSSSLLIITYWLLLYCILEYPLSHSRNVCAKGYIGQSVCWVSM